MLPVKLPLQVGLTELLLVQVYGIFLCLKHKNNMFFPSTVFFNIQSVYIVRSGRETLDPPGEMCTHCFTVYTIH